MISLTNVFDHELWRVFYYMDVANFNVCCMIQFKESVAQFAKEIIAPHASKIDQTNSFPKVCMRIYSYFFHEHKMVKEYI